MGFYYLVCAVMLGLAGLMMAMVIQSLPSSMRLIFLLVVGGAVVLFGLLNKYMFNRRWFITVMRGLLVCFSLLLMFGGLPIAIAQYPTLRQFRCDRTAVRSRLANCYIELKTLGGFGNYRKNYAQVKQAKILLVNAKSSSKPGGKLRSDPINVELSPVFLVVQAGVSQKLQTVKPYEPVATSVVTQINQFLQGDQAALSIDIMDVSWDSNSDGFGGGSRMLSQREHIFTSLFLIPMNFCLGVLFLLKIFAVETESDDD